MPFFFFVFRDHYLYKKQTTKVESFFEGCWDIDVFGFVWGDSLDDFFGREGLLEGSYVKNLSGS